MFKALLSFRAISLLIQFVVYYVILFWFSDQFQNFVLSTSLGGLIIMIMNPQPIEMLFLRSIKSENTIYLNAVKTAHLFHIILVLIMLIILDYFQIFTLKLPTILVLGMAGSLYNWRQKALFSNKLYFLFIERLVTSAALLLFVSFGGSTTDMLIFVYASALTISGMAAYIHFRMFKYQFMIKKILFIRLYNNVLPSLLNSTANHYDKVLINNSGIISTGYLLAERLSELLRGVIKDYGTSLTYTFFSRAKIRIVQAPYFLIISTGVVVSLGLCYYTNLTEKYMGSWLYSLVLILTLCFSYYNNVTYSILKRRVIARVEWNVTLIPNLLRIGIGSLAFSRLGVIGFLLATVVFRLFQTYQVARIRRDKR